MRTKLKGSEVVPVTRYMTETGHLGLRETEYTSETRSPLGLILSCFPASETIGWPLSYRFFSQY